MREMPDSAPARWPPFFIMRVINILFTGSDRWNVGDDLVRSGVMALIHAALPTDVYLNLFLYDFTGPSQPTSVLKEDKNVVYAVDLPRMLPLMDLVVVPGLMVGYELRPLYEALKATKQAHKLVCIGGMNENEYCKGHCEQSPAKDCLKEARLVIGRTKQHPAVLDDLGVEYHALPCPSIFGWEAAASDTGQMSQIWFLAFSIQLAIGSPDAVPNHCTGRQAHFAAAEMLELANKSGLSPYLVAHHKSEWIQHSVKFPRMPVIFHSDWANTLSVYGHANAIVTTRLHAGLLGVAMGIPALIVNSTERHQHALRFFPMVPVGYTLEDYTLFIDVYNSPAAREDYRERCKHFRAETFSCYMELLRPVLAEVIA